MDDLERDAGQLRKRSEARLRAALDSVGDGAWDWNIRSGEVFYSDRWIASLGYARREVRPEVAFWEGMIHPDDAARVAALLARHLAGETSVFHCEYRLRQASGAYRHTLDRGRVIEWDSESRPLRMVGTNCDVEEQRRAYLAREEAERQRGEALRERERALEQLRVLRGLLPICAGCKRVRSDAGYWTEIDEYLEAHSEASISHGICPDCRSAFDAAHTLPLRSSAPAARPRRRGWDHLLSGPPPGRVLSLDLVLRAMAQVRLDPALAARVDAEESADDFWSAFLRVCDELPDAESGPAR